MKVICIRTYGRMSEGKIYECNKESLYTWFFFRNRFIGNIRTDEFNNLSDYFISIEDHRNNIIDKILK